MVSNHSDLQAIARIETAARCVILSPHLDDGVLSCGGLTARISANLPVEIWTFFSHAPLIGPYSPLARWFHDVSGGSSGAWLAWQRRREDRRACGIIGARTRHFRWHDAVYRKRTNGQPAYETCRHAHWEPDDETVVREMASTLNDMLLPSDIVLSPLGVGQHVDHLIVRAALERVHHPNVMHYVDVPYVSTYPEEVQLKTSGMECVQYDLRPADVDAWVSSVMQYTSQIGMLETAVGPLPALIRGLASTGPLCLYA